MTLWRLFSWTQDRWTNQRCGGSVSDIWGGIFFLRQPPVHLLSGGEQAECSPALRGVSILSGAPCGWTNSACLTSGTSWSTDMAEEWGYFLLAYTQVIFKWAPVGCTVAAQSESNKLRNKISDTICQWAFITMIHSRVTIPFVTISKITVAERI